MSNGIVRRISERKRTALKFGSHHERLNEMEKVLIAQHGNIDLLKKVILRLEIDTEAMGSVIADMIGALPWWRRRRFGVDYLKRMRSVVVERKQQQIGCESIAQMLRTLGLCVQAQKAAAVKGNGEAPTSA